MFEEQQRQVIRSLKTPQSSRSWLIVGSRGVGKHVFAEQLISALTHNLNAYNPAVQWVRCGLTETSKKEVQKAILAGEEFDSTNLNRKTEITIDEIQEACRFLSLKSDTLKIVVFDLADDMNENAQNALLKTLEEPFPGCLLLLLCENVGHLLPTILSRCQKVHLTSPDSEEFKKQLKQKYEELSSMELNELGGLSNYMMAIADEIMAKNGLSIYHELQQLVQTSETLNEGQLLNFAERVTVDKESFELVKKFVLYYLYTTAKELSKSSLEQANLLSENFIKVQKQFDEIDSKNLDKKYNLISIMQQIRGDL